MTLVNYLIKKSGIQSQFIWSLAFAIFVAVLEAAAVAAAIPLSKQVLGDLNSLSVLTLSAVPALFVLKGIATCLAQRYISNTVYEAKARLTNLIAEKITPAYLASGEGISAKILAMFTTESQHLVGYFLAPASVLISELVVVVFIGVFLLYYDTIATSSVLVFTAVSAGIYHLKIGSWIEKVGQKRKNKEEYRVGYLSDLLRTLDIATALNRSQFLKHRLYTSSLEVAKLEGLQYFSTQLPKIWLETTTVTFVFISIFTIHGTTNIKQSFTLLSIYLLASFRILPSINRILNSLQTLRYAQPIISQFAAIVKQEASEQIINKSKLSDDILLAINDEEDSNKRIIISKGRKIAIMGASGIGKSRLLSSIMFNTPSKQKISYNFPRYQSLTFGYVPQDNSLITGDYWQNITFTENKSQENSGMLTTTLLEKWTRELDLEDLALRITDTHRLDDHSISGGQRQRIGFLRAIAADPDLYLMDEPTSSLDQRNKNVILSMIRSVDAAMIIVTHDPEVAAQCNDVYHLTDKGLRNARTEQ